MNRCWYLLARSSLESVSGRIQREFDLPEFRFDSEIDNEWGIVEKDGVELNVTHVTQGRRERIEELPREFPDHDFLILVTEKGESTKDSDHWFLDTTIQSVSQRLANVLAVDVHYLVGWGPNRIPRFLVFKPQ